MAPELLNAFRLFCMVASCAALIVALYMQAV